MKTLKSYDNGIYCLDAEYISNDIAAVYIIVEGNEVAIIETASSHSVPVIIQALNHLKLGLDQVKYIIPTHIHLDHSGGCGALLKQCPNADILVHPRGLRHMIDPSKLVAGAKAVYGEQKFNDLYGEISGIDENRIFAQEDETSVFLGERELFFIHTEGHAKHHFCIIDKGSQGVFTGDTFGLSYPALNSLSNNANPCVIIPTTTPIHFDPNAMRASIKRILSYKPSALYLTHFGAVKMIDFAGEQLNNWIDLYEQLLKNDPNCSEETLLQQLMDLTKKELKQQHGITDKHVDQFLTYDLTLNAQGLYHYRQSL